MSQTPSLTVSLRDAAIAAALTGTVVVVLGYASGLGLEVQQSLAQPPSQPAAPSLSEQSHTTEPMPTMPSQMVAMLDDAGRWSPMPVDHLTDPPTERPTEPGLTEPTDPGTTEPTPDVDEPAVVAGAARGPAGGRHGHVAAGIAARLRVCSVRGHRRWWEVPSRLPGR